VGVARRDGLGRRVRPRLGPWPPAPGAIALLITTASVEFVRGALFIAILPGYLREDRGLSATAVGLIVSAQYLADIVVKTLGGAATDRRGAWPVLLPTLCISAAAAFAIPRATTVPALALAAMAFGVGAAANWPAAVAGVTGLSGQGTEGSSLSLLFVAWIGFGGLGPVLSSVLAAHGYAAAFRLVEAVALVAPATALVGLVARLKTPAGARLDPSVSGLRPTLDRLRRIRVLLPPIYLPAVALGMLLPTLAPFTQDVLHLPRTALGLLLLAGGAACVAALPVVGTLVDRFGYRPFLVGGLAVAGLITAWFPEAHTGAQLTVRAVAFGLAYAAILPSWNKMLVEASPVGRRGTFMGLFMAVEGLGVGSGPALGGLLWSRFGPSAPFFGAATLVLAMVAYYLVLFARRGRAADWV
jgi:DHA1 family multidrug resistance protein-like MFS transporter